MNVDQEDAGIAEITIESLRAEVARLREERDVVVGQVRHFCESRDKVLDERDALRAVVEDLVKAMEMWGSWEDGIPEAGEDEFGKVGKAYKAGRAALEADHG